MNGVKKGKIVQFYFSHINAIAQAKNVTITQNWHGSTHKNMSTECSQCHALLACSSDQHCWCIALPNILPLTRDNTCLCRSCLITKINTFLEQQYQIQPLTHLLALAAEYRSAPANIEGLDYTIEGGLYVFTRWSHLKRGTCCGNGCQHCPWKSKPHIQ